MTLDTFSTARLRAERLTDGHLPELRRMDQDPRFMAHLGGVRDGEGTAAYLGWNLEHWAEYGFGLWMLRDSETGGMVGRAVLRHLDVEGVDEVEVGYGFVPQVWGRGLATEVARACVSLGRERLGLATIVAVTRPEHAASQRVMRKVGLVYEREFLHAGSPHLLFRTRDGDVAPVSRTV
ncbi:MAG TPA: GNAT family N-acetyltransferase [Gemmatimonadales bacterium]|nr:GNAT family N-acetyltransferase [Gemmatimonadales bacterium]